MTLADTVAGTRTVPQPSDCFAVAGLLLTSAALVRGPLPLPADVRRVGALGVATVLGGRAFSAWQGEPPWSFHGHPPNDSCGSISTTSSAFAIRVIEVDAETGIAEMAAFIDEGGNNFWGIEAFELDGVEYIAASDRDKGLYIMKYTPTP